MPRRSSKGTADSSPHKTRRVAEPGDARDALDASMRLLARRAHSRAELRLKLTRRGYASTAIDEACARVAELGYLDDSSFASGLVRRRSGLRGPLALSAELAARGVGRAQAAAALAEFDSDAQVRSATRLAERLYARKPVAGYRALLDSVGPKLLRRGFSAAVVRAACQAVLSGAPDIPDD